MGRQKQNSGAGAFEEQFRQVWSLIESGDSFVVSGHVKVDGDALGGMLAMRLVLLDMGKTVRAVHCEPLPYAYRFLPGFDSVCLPDEIADDEQYDVGIVLDSGALSRLGSASAIVQRARDLISIDHHKDWQDFGAVNLIDLQAAAVGETLFELFKWAGVPLDKRVALALYTSIVTDTGGFRYATTTARTHAIASDLLASGVDPGEVGRYLYDNRPIALLQLLGLALGTIDQACGGRITWMSVDADMIDRTCAGPEHLEGFVNYPRSVDGTEVAVLFAELEPAKTKVSIRSNVSVDVGAIAAQFGGGGHYRAAGCTIEAPLKEARKQIIDACAKMIGDETCG